MQTHAIVELEDGSLTITVAAPKGRTSKVLQCIRIPLADLSKDAVGNALRSFDEGVLAGTKGVHVVLGERRIQHFVSTVPKMSGSDVSEYVVREALRLTGMPSAEDVLVAPRLLRRLPGGRLVLGATALARNLWEPIHDAFRSVGIDVLSLQSMEACLALAAKPEHGNHVAVLECNGGRARFVLCDGVCPVQVRRILIGGGGEGNAGALVAHLAMELPRTIDWLRETGNAAPSLLLLGSRVHVDADSIEMIRGDLERAIKAETYLETAEGQAAPGLGVAMLLHAIAAGSVPASLLNPPVVKLPYGATHILGLAAVAAAGLVCSLSAVVDGREFLALHHHVDVAASETQRLSNELAQIARESVNASTVDPEGGKLQAVLNLRRPISRLISEVSNAASEKIHLDELKFASSEKVVVTGVVQAGSRKDALAAMADYSRQLRTLPYLQNNGQEEINEVAGQSNCFRFRLMMSWRNL
jgi:hypothetical protein